MLSAEYLATPALFAYGASIDRLGRPRYVLAPHICLIDDALVNAAKNEGVHTIIEVAPRHGKSELTSKHNPAWYLGTYPDRRIALASYESDFAAEWGQKARDLFATHGPAFGQKLHPTIRSRKRWATTRGGEMITAGVGGVLTGRGANQLIIDDPVKNMKDAQSELMREDAWNWFSTTAYTRLEPGGSCVLMATRWHEDDLIGRALANMPGVWKRIRIPAISEGAESDPLGREAGKACWPARYDRERLEASRKVLGQHMFASLYQQAPSPATGGIFRTEAFANVYQREGAVVRLGPHAYNLNRLEIMAVADLAVTTKRSSDYTVVLCFAVTPEKDIILLDLWRDRVEGPDHQNVIKLFAARNRVGRIGIESVGYQVALTQQLAREGVNVVEIYPDSDKTSRALYAANKLETAKVWIPDAIAAPWLPGLIKECVGFPNAAHDDQVDCLGYAVAMVGESLEAEWRELLEEQAA